MDNTKWRPLSTLLHSRRGSTSVHSRGETLPIEDGLEEIDIYAYREYVANLRFDLSKSQGGESKLKNLLSVLSAYPYIYTYIRTLEFKGLEEFSSETSHCIQSFLRGLVKHGEGYLQVLKVEEDAWVKLSTDIQKLFIRLLTSCSNLHTLSMVIHFPDFYYSLDFLRALKGIQYLRLVGYPYNAKDESNPARTARDINLQSSPVPYTDSNGDIFLQKLYLHGEAAKRLEDYLGHPDCHLRVSQLQKLYIDGAGERMDPAISRILKRGASASIKSLAWLPSPRHAVETRESANLTDMHPQTLILLVPILGPLRKLDAVISVLSHKFKIKTDKVQELVLCYTGKEQPNPFYDKHQSKADKITYGLRDMLQRANHEFTTASTRSKFPQLQKIRLWLSLDHHKESWEELEDLHLGQRHWYPEYWTPSMNGDWVCADDWDLAYECAPALHNNASRLWLKIIPYGTDSKIFNRMLVDADGTSDVIEPVEQSSCCQLQSNRCFRFICLIYCNDR